MALILASASPRRQELLRNAGIIFVVHAANVAEDFVLGEDPQTCAMRLAQLKAQTIFHLNPQNFVLGADTLVVVDNLILGKPRDEEDAKRMLRLLSGKTHQVITGVCLVGTQLETKNSQLPTALIDVRHETTSVSMAELSENDIAQYVATGEPLDKAGAYAIQGRASRWVDRIEGDYFNVVGLPISLVYRMLREHGAL